MSLIDIRMDATSFSIDGYEIGPRVGHRVRRVCPISTWDEVRTVLDGFDIDQPARDAEELNKLKDVLRTLNEENDILHEIIRAGKKTGEIK